MVEESWVAKLETPSFSLCSHSQEADGINASTELTFYSVEDLGPENSTTCN